MNNEKLLPRANRLLGEGRKAEAEALYWEFQERHPKLAWTAEINLEHCRMRDRDKPFDRQARVEGTSSASQDSDGCLDYETSTGNLDPVTRILMINAGGSAQDSAMKADLIQFVKNIWKDKSPDAPVKTVKTIPPDWPEDLMLRPLPRSTNDYRWMLDYQNDAPSRDGKGLSVVVPTYNRPKTLALTLACLTRQATPYDFEVLVVDDGSTDDIFSVTRRFEKLLDVKLLRQIDRGYQLCAARNLGVRAARYPWIGILDCDMAPGPNWVQSCCENLAVSENWTLIGLRKHVDTSGLDAERLLKDITPLTTLPEIQTRNGEVRQSQTASITDWRADAFAATEDLALHDYPFRYFSGGNVAFAKWWFDRVDGFDEAFTAWGGEDNEFGYRLYRAGCFFKSEAACLAFHQEPYGTEHTTDRTAGRQLTQPVREERMPLFYRKQKPLAEATIRKVPLVSIYVPAYNCEQYIVPCVESALRQTVTDLEVVICNDGSTDQTRTVLDAKYAMNPRVTVINQPNGGTAAASNTAVKHCRGYYIGQLDADDLLKSDAVELCLREFKNDSALVCVYTTNYNFYHDTGKQEPGYNWPVFSREKLMTAMIAHAFRLFTARAWNSTTGFNEILENAVDYDMFLKLSEVGRFKHINKCAYARRLHGGNTSTAQIDRQKENHFIANNASLHRQNIFHWRLSPHSKSDPSSRKSIWVTER